MRNWVVCGIFLAAALLSASGSFLLWNTGGQDRIFFWVGGGCVAAAIALWALFFLFACKGSAEEAEADDRHGSMSFDDELEIWLVDRE